MTEVWDVQVHVSLMFLRATLRKPWELGAVFCFVKRATQIYTAAVSKPPHLVFTLQDYCIRQTNIELSQTGTEYVKMLPNYVPTPTLWSEDDISLLVGTSLEVRKYSEWNMSCVLC